MKQVLCATLFVVAAAAYVQAAAVGQKTEEKYTTKYNNFDVDSVLNNTKILKSYVKCVLGEGPCTNEGRELASKYLKLRFTLIDGFDFPKFFRFV